MKITKTKVTKIELTQMGEHNLDPVQIIAEDFGKGYGRITISCYGKSWTNSWGGMGDETIIPFILTSNVEYLAEKLMPIYNKFTIDWDKVNEKVFGPDPSFMDGHIEAVNAIDFDEKLTEHYGADWRMDLPERLTTEYRYLCRIIVAVQEGLRVSNNLDK